MPLRDELLVPIAGDNPGGAEMRYDPIFDKIKEARREDDDAPQGEWATERKVADFPTVIKLATDALATKTKDLQLAAWLTEALLRRQGFAGLRDGLDVMAGLVDQFWDHLYPEIDDGDAEMRAAPLEWVAVKLDLPVRFVPLDRAGFGLVKQRDARTVPSESDGLGDSTKAATRAAAIAGGKSTPEEIEAAFTATPKAWYRALVADIQGSLDSLKALDEVSSTKFADAAPNFSRLRDALDEVLRSVNTQLKRKLELDPDPIEMAPVGAGDDGSGATLDLSTSVSGGSLSAEPGSLADAASRIIAVARYLRKTTPHNPASYLMLRGFRWGELRASSVLDPKLLEAPPTTIRTNLKTLLLDARWPELLETAESVMGTPHGRGWIDLQRYAITACDSLGGDYDTVGAALRGALRSLLVDLPQLLEMTLMDDTPTANAETRSWLRRTIRLDPALTASDADQLPDLGLEPTTRDPIALANSEARAGRPERAIEVLMRELAREKTRRGRFLYQSQLARVMVDAGHDPVAMPILEELIADIEAFRLEEWETGTVVAAPMSLLYRCLEKTGADESMRQTLYLRICRLDPIQAISFTPR